jgi:hypothetical protein
MDTQHNPVAGIFDKNSDWIFPSQRCAGGRTFGPTCWRTAKRVRRWP